MEDQMRVWIQDVATDNDVMFIVIRDYAVLLKCKFGVEECDFAEFLPDKQTSDSLVSGTIVKRDDKLFIFPIKDNYVFIYSITKRKWTKKSIPTWGVSKEFFGKIESEDYSITLGKGFAGIAIIKNDIEYVELPESYKENCDENNSYLGPAGSILNNTVYFPSGDGRYIYIYDIACKRFLPEIETQNRIRSCHVYGDQLWMIPKNRNVITYREIGYGSNDKSISLPNGFAGEGEHWFQKSVILKDSIVLFPSFSNMLIKIDLKELRAVCLYQFDGLEEQKYSCAGILDENRVWGFDARNMRLDIINLNEDKISRYHMNYSADAKRVILLSMRMCEESEDVTLGDFLKEL